MVWQTHLVFGLLFSLAGLQLLGLPLTIGAALLAALGSLLPDLDASESKVKHLRLPLGRRTRNAIKPFGVVSDTAHAVFGHRGLLHSFVAVLLLTGLLVIVQLTVGGSDQLYLALLLGYTSHLLIDSFTKSGTRLLYPLPITIRFLPHPIAVRTGSVVDYLIAGIIVFLLLAWIGTNPTLLTELIS